MFLIPIYSPIILKSTEIGPCGYLVITPIISFLFNSLVYDTIVFDEYYYFILI